MPHSDKVSVIGPALETYVQSRKQELGLRKVWYGDDDSIPETPAVLITSDTKTRDIQATGQTTTNTFRFYLGVFHSRFTDPRVSRKECDALAEQVEAVLHENKSLDGLLLYSYVQTMQYGVARRGGTLMKATRLLWIATSRTRI